MQHSDIQHEAVWEKVETNATEEQTQGTTDRYTLQDLIFRYKSKSGLQAQVINIVQCVNNDMTSQRITTSTSSTQESNGKNPTNPTRDQSNMNPYQWWSNIGECRVVILKNVLYSSEKFSGFP